MGSVLGVTAGAFEAALAAAHAEVVASNNAYARGAEDGLLWVAGRRSAPLSDTDALSASASDADVPAISRAIGRELRLIEDAIYGPPSDFSRDYVVGVEGALLWAVGDSPSPPI